MLWLLLQLLSLSHVIVLYYVATLAHAVVAIVVIAVVPNALTSSIVRDHVRHVHKISLSRLEKKARCKMSAPQQQQQKPDVVAAAATAAKTTTRDETSYVSGFQRAFIEFATNYQD